MTPKDYHYGKGWINLPHTVNQVMGRLPMPRFAAAAPGLDGPKGDALLYMACQKVTGGNLPAHNQKDVGCCVSEGYSSGAEYLQCVEIAVAGEAEEYKPISHSAVYGMARELGHMLRAPDGLVGAYAAEAVSTLGVVSCEDAGDRNDDPAFAREWGSRGVPDRIKGLAKKHLVRTVSRVESWDEAKAALANGYPIPVCSDQGFTMTRDRDGFCQPRGSWSHCMLLMAYRADRDAGCILQSWGANVPNGPTALGQPDCSFWVEGRVIDRMLRQGDSFALSAFDGFPARKRPIDWLFR